MRAGDAKTVGARFGSKASTMEIGAAAPSDLMICRSSSMGGTAATVIGARVPGTTGCEGRSGVLGGAGGWETAGGAGAALAGGALAIISGASGAV